MRSLLVFSLSLSIGCADIIRNPTGNVEIPDPVTVKILIEDIDSPQESVRFPGTGQSKAALLCAESIQYTFQDKTSGSIQLETSILVNLFEEFDLKEFELPQAGRLLEINVAVGDSCGTGFSVYLENGDENIFSPQKHLFRYQASVPFTPQDGQVLLLTRLQGELFNELPQSEKKLADFLLENQGELIAASAENSDTKPLPGTSSLDP